MNIQKVFFSGLLVAALSNSCIASDDVTSSYAEARGMARATMDETYGENNYVKKYDCWRFEEKGNEDDREFAYCMSISKVTLVSQKGIDYLYILASNEMSIPDTDYGYSRGDLGVVSAFIFKKNNNQWIKEAFNKEHFLEFAFFGATGTEDAVLTELGENYWGWVFSSGNTTQGNVNYRYTILAKVGTDIQDISGGFLPETCDAGNDYLYSYKISVDKKTKTKIFPIILKEYKQDLSKDIVQNKIIKSYISSFDSKKWKYVAPSTFCNKSM